MKHLLTATLFICFLAQKGSCQALDKAVLNEFSRNMQNRMKVNEFAMGGAYTVMKEAFPKKSHFEIMEALEGFGKSNIVYNAFFYRLYKKVGGNGESLRLHLQGLCDSYKLAGKVAEYIEFNFKTRLANERKVLPLAGKKEFLNNNPNALTPEVIEERFLKENPEITKAKEQPFGLLRFKHYKDNLPKLIGGTVLDTLEGKKYVFYVIFRYGVIGFDKERETYFPVYIETCARGCDLEVRLDQFDRLSILTGIGDLIKMNLDQLTYTRRINASSP